MARCIDIKQLYQCETCSHHFSGKCDTWCECGESYRPAMALLKIIEAEEVRHGEWINNHCSVCGMTPIGEELWKHLDIDPPRFEYCMDFCPCCGAKMDGGTK